MTHALTRPLAHALIRPLARTAGVAAMAAALAVPLVVAPAPAAALTQVQRLTLMDLRDLGMTRVDVTRLTTVQMSAIRAVAHRPGRQGGKRMHVRSILGGPDTLRGLFR